MSDLVERLRERAWDMSAKGDNLCHEAADTIERLRQALMLACGFIDPETDPPRTSNRELLAVLRAALAQPNERVG